MLVLEQNNTLTIPARIPSENSSRRGRLPDQRARPPLTVLGLLGAVIVVCAAGVALGTIALWFSPLWVLMGLAGGGVTLVALKRPEIAVLAILAAKSTIIFQERMPLIPIPVGSLHIADVILLALLGLIVLRWLAESDFHIVDTPLDLPLAAFYGAAVLSTLMAIRTSSLDFNEGLRGIRDITFYLTIFVVTNLVREQRQLNLLLRGFFVLATLVAMAMVAQYAIGGSLQLLPGRVETLATRGETYGGVFRILPPGQSLILVAFIVSTVTLVLTRIGLSSILRFLQWGLLGLVVLLTFNRTYWVAVGLELPLLGLSINGQHRRRIIGWGLLVAFLGAVTLPVALAQPGSRIASLASASYERMSTLVDPRTPGESSIEMRYIEYEHALPQIPSLPLLGLGIGARYRPWDPRVDWEQPGGLGFDGRAYIHNGHLWILLQSGVLGYLCFAWLSLAFLVRGFRHWWDIPSLHTRAAVLGFSLAYVGVLVSSLSSPLVIEPFWIPVIGLMMGFNESAIRIAQAHPDHATADTPLALETHGATQLA